MQPTHLLCQDCVVQRVLGHRGCDEEAHHTGRYARPCDHQEEVRERAEPGADQGDADECEGVGQCEGGREQRADKVLPLREEPLEPDDGVAVHLPEDHRHRVDDEQQPVPLLVPDKS